MKKGLGNTGCLQTSFDDTYQMKFSHCETVWSLLTLKSQALGCWPHCPCCSFADLFQIYFWHYHALFRQTERYRKQGGRDFAKCFGSDSWPLKTER